MRSKLSLVLALILSSLVHPASAHFLWVDVDAATAGKSTATFSFAEEPEPGAEHLLDRIAPTKAWLRAGSDPVSLELKPRVDGDTAVYAAQFNAEKSHSIESACRYGVFDRGDSPALLQYYAKHLTLTAADDLENLARADRLAVDLVPAITDSGLTVTLLHDGAPVPAAELHLHGDESATLTTNEKGVAVIPGPLRSAYALRTMVTDADAAGTLDDKDYDQTWHVVTLTLRLPDASTATVAADSAGASELLTAARSARAVWDGFPGFQCKLKLHDEHTQSAGTLTVTADGAVELDAVEVDGFIEQQLESLVMHRMPGSAVGGDEASFEPQASPHVLGRPVRLAEDRMGSVYRIRDHVITEVNRTMPGQRFTISVLDVARNEEGKYLPHVFTVDFWDTGDNRLNQSLTYFHRWKRVATFDLPDELQMVVSSAQGRRLIRLEFLDHQLLSPTAD